MKYTLLRIFTIIPSFLSRIMSSVPIFMINTAMGAAIMTYYKDIIGDVCKWMVPCLVVIIFNAIWDVKAGIKCKETISPVHKLIDVVSRILSYACWVVFAVAVGHNTDNSKITWYVMSVILFIEGMCCIENIMVFHGWSLRTKGIVSMIGKLISKWLGIDVNGNEIINAPICGHLPETTEETNNKK